MGNEMLAGDTELAAYKDLAGRTDPAARMGPGKHMNPQAHRELGMRMDFVTHKEPSRRRHWTLAESTGDELATQAKVGVHMDLLVVCKDLAARTDLEVQEERF